MCMRTFLFFYEKKIETYSTLLNLISFLWIRISIEVIWSNNHLNWLFKSNVHIENNLMNFMRLPFNWIIWILYACEFNESANEIFQLASEHNPFECQILDEFSFGEKNSIWCINFNWKTCKYKSFKFPNGKLKHLNWLKFQATTTTQVQAQVDRKTS